MAGLTVTEKLIQSHLLAGEMKPGEEIAIKIDQTLTQDATGTMVMLELEAMGLTRAKTEVSVQYIDHNMLQEDHKNPDDHLFLLSCCRRFGLWFSRPGNGVSHPVHQERFGKPGKTLLGSDSHTPAAGAIGMFALGSGGMEVALAIAGEPAYIKMPRVHGVRLVGRLPEWVSAKDIILTLLARHGVDGGVGSVFEYFGPGLDGLNAMDRHVIANMGVELGAMTTVFPSDREVRRFLRSQGRDEDWTEIMADPDCAYSTLEEVDLGSLEPMIAMPSSPGNVKAVREVAGQVIYQSYIGSSANPGYRDFAIAAEMVRGRRVHPRVSFDINPTSRQLLEDIARDGHLFSLIRAGARLHQAGCGGCIGMGQAPATKELSLRTVPRNFPGRSGTREDKVCLVSPETATASALLGKITDPRTLGIRYPTLSEANRRDVDAGYLLPPLAIDEALRTKIIKGPNIAELPTFDPLQNVLTTVCLLKVGDHISTDEILPAGAKALPYRSNIPKIAEFTFDAVDPTYVTRARELIGQGHCIVAGLNYGQGSSREHAALAPRFLGLRFVLAKSFARIHSQNLVNFGILPLVFRAPRDYDRIRPGDEIELREIQTCLDEGSVHNVHNVTRNETYEATHSLTQHQLNVLRAGGIINHMKQQMRRLGSIEKSGPDEMAPDLVETSIAPIT